MVNYGLLKVEKLQSSYNKPNRNKDGEDWGRLKRIANDKLETFS